MKDHIEPYRAERIPHGVRSDLRWRKGRPEDEALFLGDMVEIRGLDAERLRQHAGIVVGEQIGDRQGAVFRKLSVRKCQQEFAAFVWQALDRMRDTGGKVPEVTGRHVGNEIVAIMVDCCDAGLACQHERPFGLLVPVQLADAAWRQAHVDPGHRKSRPAAHAA